MGAPKGNTYASKITLQDARELADKALSVVGDNCFYLSKVADKCGTYRQKFEYVLKKFNDDEYVFNTIKRMHNKCEAIVMEKTGNKEIAPALGIFVLKSYHGLMETSRQETDITTKGKSFNIKGLIDFE